MDEHTHGAPPAAEPAPEPQFPTGYTTYVPAQPMPSQPSYDAPTTDVQPEYGAHRYAEQPPAAAPPQHFPPAVPPPAAPAWNVTPVAHERRRRRLPVVRILAITLPILLLLGGGAAWLLRPQTDAHYLKALRVANLSAEYPNAKAAVAHAKGFCKQLGNGHALEGYDAEKVGVSFYCAEYLPGFKVIPTPAQLQEKYLTAMRDGGFGGEYPSDAAAVAHAQSVCTGLKNGGKQQGMPVDQVGVDAYCPEFSAGFHVLATETVKGTFTLHDSTPSIYYSSINSSEDGCSGSGGYSDISAGTSVIIKNGSGKLLAETSLGRGTGGYTYCEFPFTVELTEGEDDYVVTVSHRGDLHYTFERLQSDGIAATLGS